MKKYLKVSVLKMDTKLARFIDGTKKELTTLFGFELKEPTITLIETRQEMDMILGRETPSWMVGTAFGFFNIFIFSPKAFAKVANRKVEDFWEVLHHEYCHIYIKQMVQTDRPIWLNEGIANYFAGKKLSAKIVSEKELLNFSEYYHCGGEKVYFMGQFWVELLVKKFGIKKLVELIKTFVPNMTEIEFGKRFKKVYGFHANKKDFAKLLK